MKKPFNPYDIFGVSRKSGKAEIKKQFRRKAKATHPDRGGNNDDFVALNKAYTLLMDDQRRKTYDETGATEHDPNSKAWGILCHHFLGIIKSNDLDALKSRDILTNLKNSCREDGKKIDMDIASVKKELEKLQEVKSRLKSDDGDNKPLHFLLEEKISQFSNQILDMERQKEGIQEAMKILDRFRYEFDSDAESSPVSFINHIWKRMGTAGTTSATGY